MDLTSIVIKPEDMLQKSNDARELLNLIAAKLNGANKGENYYNIHIEKKFFTKEAMDQVVALYLQAGWKDVFCEMSSESVVYKPGTSFKIKRP